MYIISTCKIVLAALIIGVICGFFGVMYFEFCRYRELPIVEFTNKTCKNVINFKNGDAYNCNDVNVVLRRYRSNHVL